MSLSKRFRDALEAGRSAVQQADSAVVLSGDVSGPSQFAIPSIGYAALAADADFDLVAAKISSKRPGLKNQRRILITNSADLRLYQIEDVITEYLPFPTDAEVDAITDKMRIYNARRLQLMCEKWSLPRLLTLGEPSHAILRDLQNWTANIPAVEHF